MTVDIPIAFVQMEIDKSGEMVIMKIRGELLDIVLEISPEIYKKTMLLKKRFSNSFMYMC